MSVHGWTGLLLPKDVYVYMTSSKRTSAESQGYHFIHLFSHAGILRQKTFLCVEGWGVGVEHFLMALGP